MDTRAITTILIQKITAEGTVLIREAIFCYMEKESKLYQTLSRSSGARYMPSPGSIP